MSTERDPVWWKDDKSSSWSPRLGWFRIFKFLFFLPFHVVNQLERLSSHRPTDSSWRESAFFFPPVFGISWVKQPWLKIWHPTRVESTCFTLIRSNSSLEGAGRHFVPAARRETPRQLPPRKHQQLSRFVRIQNHITSAPFCVISRLFEGPRRKGASLHRLGISFATSNAQPLVCERVLFEGLQTINWAREPIFIQALTGSL